MGHRTAPPPLQSAQELDLSICQFVFLFVFGTELLHTLYIWPRHLIYQFWLISLNACGKDFQCKNKLLMQSCAIQLVV